MSNIHFGVQTYSWQMSYNKFRGCIAHIADVIRLAGFTGMEAEVCMLDTLFPDVEKVRSILQKRNLKFSALALPLNWLGSKETDEEKELADKAIAFVKGMGDCKLILCHLPQSDRNELKQRQAHQIACIKAVAERAADAGIVTGFHPNSSFGSAFRTREDYCVLMDEISNSPLGFVPDAGHIAHGSMDPLGIIKEYHEKVVHVHFKDMSDDEKWSSMGKGCINFPDIVDYLNEVNYNGWIMVEEESAYAALDPDSVTLENGKYIRMLTRESV